MKRVVTVAALMLGALSVFCASDAVADPPSSGDAPVMLQQKQEAAAEVIVLHATNEGKGIDACAAHLKALKQPPFSSYDSYACLTEKKLAMKLNATASMETPDKGKLHLTLNKVIDRKDKKPKYDVNVQLDKADGSKYTSLNAKAPHSKWFFLAGPKHKKGILVYAIRLLDK